MAPGPGGGAAHAQLPRAGSQRPNARAAPQAAIDGSAGRRMLQQPASSTTLPSQVITSWVSGGAAARRGWAGHSSERRRGCCLCVHLPRLTCARAALALLPSSPPPGQDGAAVARAAGRRERAAAHVQQVGLGGAVERGERGVVGEQSLAPRRRALACTPRAAAWTRCRSWWPTCSWPSGTWRGRCACEGRGQPRQLMRRRGHLARLPTHHALLLPFPGCAAVAVHGLQLCRAVSCGGSHLTAPPPRPARPPRWTPCRTPWSTTTARPARRPARPAPRPWAACPPTSP